uniref:CinA C-terminal domain-containing protein n=1 Tax=Magnetococcus massalia (strain MO-1) TaxID=451514 RepID=A0A1S7LJQ0_MAGMO|nr:Conserved protein of unknown function. putative competence/damage-inducible protein cinA [Candidatus Magnetococcus massalia]
MLVMKSLLVTPRWSELDGLMTPSGRPLLDLSLISLGFSRVDTLEVDPNLPFDPLELPGRYDLILVQADGQGSRLRRGVLSRLGLSLGLDEEQGGGLKVMGATPLRNSEGRAVGFAAAKRGILLAYCEHGLNEVLGSLHQAIHELLQKGSGRVRSRVEPQCWLVECSGDLSTVTAGMDLPMAKAIHANCNAQMLPNGDCALLIPGVENSGFADELKVAYGARLYAQEPVLLEQQLAELLRARGLTVATAESCTGGLVAARLTAISGSSAFVDAAWVTYSNEAKMRHVDGMEPLLTAHGAVSHEVAHALARAALRSHKTDMAVAVTGIAGPTGGSEDKPVGTVFLAAVTRSGSVLSHRGLYTGSRDRIRYQSSQTALHLLRRLAMEV